MSRLNVDDVLERLAEQRREQDCGSAMTLNAVVFEDDPGAPLIAALEVLAKKHPARTILLDDSAKPDAVEITAALPQEERIELAVRGLEPAALQQIVHRLQLDGVPSVLIWAAKNFDDERAAALAGTVQSVIVDSTAAGDALHLRNLLEFVEHCGERCLCDLAFMRIAPWQDAIAQIFDDPELLEELDSIVSIEIEAASKPQAYYITGWLASRLRWTPCGPRRFCNPDGEEIAIALHRSDAPIRCIRVETARANLGVSLESKGATLCLTVEGALSRPRRCAPLHDVDDPSLLEEAILMPRSSGLFVETLQTLRAVLQLEPA